MIQLRKTLPLALSLLFLTACSSVIAPMNQKNTLTSQTVPVQTKKWKEKDNKVLLILTFSGGGTRAAALSYGVLKGLLNTPIGKKQNRSLLSEVDLISAVSGGSFTAAYYGLFGEKTFSDYEKAFLKHPVQSELIHHWLSPRNWGKLGSDFFNRSDLAAEYYAQQIFKNKKFSDMREDLPFIIINTTDLSTGMPFSFTPSNMSWICSDLDSYTISQAVTASSAVPGVFSPIVLKNFRDCNQTTNRQKSDKPFRTAKQRNPSAQKKFQDKTRYPYLHLVDGGISDNLGIRPVLEIVAAQGDDFTQLLKKYQLKHIKDIAIIIVDSADDIPPQIAQTSEEPSLEETLGAVTTLQSRRYNIDTLNLLANKTKKWKKQLNKQRCKSMKHCKKIGFHIINLNLKQLPKTLAEQTSLYKTSLELPEQQVDTLIYAGQYLLQHSKPYLKLLRKLNR